MDPDTTAQFVRDELMLDGNDRPYTVFDVGERLRDRGWLVPAYTFPANREDLAVLRMVVRNGFSHDLADLLIGDLHRHLAYLENLPQPLPRTDHAESFRH